MLRPDHPLKATTSQFQWGDMMGQNSYGSSWNGLKWMRKRKGVRKWVEWHNSVRRRWNNCFSFFFNPFHLTFSPLDHFWLIFWRDEKVHAPVENYNRFCSYPPCSISTFFIKGQTWYDFSHHGIGVWVQFHSLFKLSPKFEFENERLP